MMPDSRDLQPIAARPTGTLLALAMAPGPDRWSVTLLEDAQGNRYVKHQKLTLGIGPNYQEQWFSVRPGDSQT